MTTEGTVSPFSEEGSTRTEKVNRRALRFEVTGATIKHRLSCLVCLHRDCRTSPTLLAAIAWWETNKQYIAARHLFHLCHPEFELQKVFVTCCFPGFELAAQFTVRLHMREPGKVVNLALQWLGQVFDFFDNKFLSAHIVIYRRIAHVCKPLANRKW